jgi:hypothetical protein
MRISTWRITSHSEGVLLKRFYEKVIKVKADGEAVRVHRQFMRGGFLGAGGR